MNDIQWCRSRVVRLISIFKQMKVVNDCTGIMSRSKSASFQMKVHKLLVDFSFKIGFRVKEFVLNNVFVRIETQISRAIPMCLATKKVFSFSADIT